MSELKMKYFVLKPKAKSRNDVHAKASQRAMMTYADSLDEECGYSGDFARALAQWSAAEAVAQRHMPDEEAE